MDLKLAEKQAEQTCNNWASMYAFSPFRLLQSNQTRWRDDANHVLTSIRLSQAFCCSLTCISKCRAAVFFLNVSNLMFATAPPQK